MISSLDLLQQWNGFAVHGKLSNKRKETDKIVRKIFKVGQASLKQQTKCILEAVIKKRYFGGLEGCWFCNG